MGELVPNKATFTLSEVGEIFGKHPKTIKRWVDEGLLQEVPLPAGKHRSIPRTAVLKLLATQG